MVEVQHEPKTEVPEWSCGGYIYEDALEPIFDYVDLPPPGASSLITRYPVLRDVPWKPLDIVLTIRWLTPEECPDHGKL